MKFAKYQDHNMVSMVSK